MEWLWLILAAVVAIGLFVWGRMSGLGKSLEQAQRQAQEDTARTLGAHQSKGERPW
ncbi:hypothetical protein [Deinococcus alpinitundrae]|uniref:hypothetical protein n=1 Tax=Deinococcus alpinitundrae TaxID=468913 RepID=UPI00137A85E2|nr:hypothetical protein [Deinococcus alpinitundrae]